MASSAAQILDQWTRALTRTAHPQTTPLTAASSPAFRSAEPTAEIATPEALRARSEKWQERTLELAELVPEVAGAASLVAGMAEHIKLVVEGGDPAARKELQRRLNSYSLPRAVQLDFLVGENYIQWPELGDPYVLSPVEILTHKKPFQERDAQGRFNDVSHSVQTIRVWRPSLGNRWKSSSPHKAALDLIEAMYLHQLADSAVATSRLAGAGILVWPTSAKRLGLDENGQPYPGSQEELLGNFHRAAMQSITQRSGKDATIPFAVFVDPNLENWMPELLRIDRDDHADQYKMRFESYRLRYATACDLPIEQTTGMDGVNGWSAWAVREDSARIYMRPLVLRQVEALNKRVANPNGMTIRIDDSALITKPDNTPQIMQLAQLEMATPDSVQAALMSGSINDLEMKDPPQRDYKSNSVSSPPSDFKVGGERGGGRFAEGKPKQ